jgi:DNA polymerase-3 subunit alpha (Gram-positive type)
VTNHIYGNPERTEAMVKDYVCVDIETTGIRPKWDRIIEIGAVKVRNNQVVNTFSKLINPGIHIPARITELTGIDDKMVQNKKNIDTILPEFIEFAENDYLLGHNVIFDYSFLKQNAINLNIEFEKSGMDTLKIARKVLPKEQSKALAALCTYYGIKDENHHRAFNDAQVTSLLYSILMENYGTENPELFMPSEYVYKAKKMQPITEKQKKYLKDLVKYHNLCVDFDIDSLTKNEASRKIDKILSEKGKNFD